MTKEEIIKIFSKYSEEVIHHSTGNDSHIIPGRYKDKIINEILALQDKWISVEKKLPETGEKVLVFLNDSNSRVTNTGLAYYGLQSKEWHLSGFTKTCIKYITHWLPLLEPPTKEGE